MNLFRLIGFALVGVLSACSTPESQFGVYQQSDGAIGVHAPKGAKEDEAQDVANAECRRLGKRTAVITDNRKTVNDRFPNTYIYFCR
jgi:uncharacterized lipoprotein